MRATAGRSSSASSSNSCATTARSSAPIRASPATRPRTGWNCASASATSRTTRSRRSCVARPISRRQAARVSASFTLPEVAQLRAAGRNAVSDDPSRAHHPARARRRQVGVLHRVRRRAARRRLPGQCRDRPAAACRRRAGGPRRCRSAAQPAGVGRALRLLRRRRPGRANPEYELALDLLGNGIARSMLLDYGDFAVDARLVQLQALPRPQMLNVRLVMPAILPLLRPQSPRPLPAQDFAPHRAVYSVITLDKGKPERRPARHLRLRTQAHLRRLRHQPAPAARDGRPARGRRERAAVADDREQRRQEAALRASHDLQRQPDQPGEGRGAARRRRQRPGEIRRPRGPDGGAAGRHAVSDRHRPRHDPPGQGGRERLRRAVLLRRQGEAAAVGERQ